MSKGRVVARHGQIDCGPRWTCSRGYLAPRATRVAKMRDGHCTVFPVDCVASMRAMRIAQDRHILVTNCYTFLVDFSARYGRV